MAMKANNININKESQYMVIQLLIEILCIHNICGYYIIIIKYCVIAGGCYGYWKCVVMCGIGIGWLAIM